MRVTPRSVSLAAVLVVAVAAGCGGGAHDAERVLATTIVNAKAPLTILACEVSVSATQGAGENIIDHVRARLQYDNVARREIAAVRSVLVGRDGAGNVVRPAHGLDDRAGVKPGATGGGVWTFDRVNERWERVDCVLDRVRYADGSVWETPDPRLRALAPR